MLRIPRTDLPGVRLADPGDLTVDLALEPGRPALRLELRGRHLTEYDAGAVGEQRRQLEHVLDGETVGDRVRAARVVAEHPAERRPVRGRGVGAEEQAERPHVVVQVVLDEPRLHARPLLLDVDLEDRVHVPREVQHERAVHRLARERRAAAARQERHVPRLRHLDRRLDVVVVARDDDADRLHLVHRGIGRVEEARRGIEANIPGDDLPKFMLEVVHAGYYTLVLVRALALLVLSIAVVASGETAPAAPETTTVSPGRWIISVGM